MKKAAGNMAIFIIVILLGILTYNEVGNAKLVKADVLTNGAIEGNMTQSEKVDSNSPMKPTIVFGDELDYPPYSFVSESGEPNGYSIELAIAVAEVMGFNGVVQQGNWERVLERLDKGEIDAISGIFYSEERSLKYDFTVKYAEGRGDIFTRDGMAITEISQLAGKTIVVPSGYIVQEYLMGLNQEMTLVPVATVLEALQMVAAGTYDYAAVLKIPGIYLAKENNLTNLKANGLQIAPQDYCMAVKKGNEEMLATLNEGLQILNQTGSYKEINDRWLGVYESGNFVHTIKEYLLFFASIMLMVVLLFAWILTLRARVKAKTKDLEEAMLFNQEIIESAHEGIILYANDYTFRLWNNYMEKMTGKLSDQIIGTLPYVAFPFLIDTNLYEDIDRALQGEKFMGNDFFVVIHENEEGLWVSQSFGPLKDGEGNVIGAISTVQNITERKRDEELLKYVSLHDHMTNLYNRSLFEEEMKIFQKSREYPITIISCDLDGLKIVNDTMGHDQGDQLLIECAALLQGTLREGDILARIGGDEFAAILPETDGQTAEDIVMRIQENVEKHNLTHRNLPISISIGVATALNNEISLEKVLIAADEKMYHEKLIEKKSSRSQIINSLMVALAEKDYITEGHSQRLSQYTEKMVKQLGLPSNVMINQNLLNQVHDLGKVGIPDSILLKPGKLTEEEWVIMRQHPEKGYRIAMASPDLAHIADLILKHHEKWDGTGYQLGLKGEEIPIECRILAIVDAFDAMTNDRPYSNAITDEEARKEIKRCAGTQFDPNLVEIFLRIS